MWKKGVQINSMKKNLHKSGLFSWFNCLVVVLRLGIHDSLLTITSHSSIKKKKKKLFFVFDFENLVSKQRTQKENNKKRVTVDNEMALRYLKTVNCHLL